MEVNFTVQISTAVVLADSVESVFGTVFVTVEYQDASFIMVSEPEFESGWDSEQNRDGSRANTARVRHGRSIYDGEMHSQSDSFLGKYCRKNAENIRI